MSELDPRHREQIEAVLQRRLTDQELAPADDLSALSDEQLRVARELARQQAVLCSLYLRAVAPVSIGVAKAFMDRLG